MTYPDGIAFVRLCFGTGGGLRAPGVRRDHHTLGLVGERSVVG